MFKVLFWPQKYWPRINCSVWFCFLAPTKATSFSTLTRRLSMTRQGSTRFWFREIPAHPLLLRKIRHLKRSGETLDGSPSKMRTLHPGCKFNFVRHCSTLFDIVIMFIYGYISPCSQHGHWGFKISKRLEELQELKYKEPGWKPSNTKVPRLPTKHFKILPRE